jgi:diguanylate cyclase (GGDEF)-like protein
LRRARAELERATLETRRLAAQVELLSGHDPRTGLPTLVRLREHADMALGRARRSRRSVGLISIVVPALRALRAQAGDAAADAALAEIALRLDGTVRAGDLLAHAGGDELALLMPDLPPDEASVLLLATAARLRAVVTAPVTAGGRSWPVVLQLGAARSPEDGVDSTSLLASARRARHAMTRRALHDVLAVA